MEHTAVSKKTFLVSWILLTLLTFALLFVATSSLGGPARSFLILLMMGVQAYLVSFYFMHLRFEKFPLVLSVVLGIVLTALLLYAVILWDGSRIVKLSVP